METIKVPLLEYGFAKSVPPGQAESGDLHFVRCTQEGILIAAVDGVGHGAEAASVANAALSVIRESLNEPVISLIERCHQKLRGTRGVVLSLAFIDPKQAMMTWIGIGNVQGVLVRARASQGTAQETLLLRGGVVGAQLPPLQATVLPIARGDTLYFATDGVRGEFAGNLPAMENPQRAAERILDRFHNGIDDGLVLVARFTGIGL
ncbi:MAG TPA: SpoIIE family protein phosphatase [Candidatus Acidoferrum sp.]|nr:SpoIIE family protein phosphatase [Candidatus Acidoferrum sp.]